MRAAPALLVCCAVAAGGCTALGLGKKRSPYDGVLRFEVEPRVRAGAPVRLGIQNDSPAHAAFNPCTRLLLQRFDGLGWTPVRGYRACTSAPAVALAPGAGTGLDLAPMPPGQSYRVVLLAADESVLDASQSGRRQRVQSSAPFDVVR